MGIEEVHKIQHHHLLLRQRKKKKTDVSTVLKCESDYVKSQQFSRETNKVYDPREVAECPNKWITPLEAIRRKNK